MYIDYHPNYFFWLDRKLKAKLLAEDFEILTYNKDFLFVGVKLP